MPDKSRKRYTFKAPEGVDLEDKKPGDKLEAVVEFEVEKDGKLCLKKINGIELQEDDKEEMKEGNTPATFAGSFGEDTDY